MSAAENVEVPLRLTETPVAERRRRVDELLELVGLGGRAKHRPAELSGGEQQRVAIARALAADPQILIADEPTGQLDSKTGASIMALIRHLVRDTGLAAVVATHDQTLIEAAHHRIELRDGTVHDSDAAAPANFERRTPSRMPTAQLARLGAAPSGGRRQQEGSDPLMPERNP